MMKVPKKIVEKYFSFSNILYVLFLSDFCRVSKNRRHCLRVNHREKRADCQTGALQCERLYAAKCGIILFQFPVLLIRNGLTPFVGVLFARNFDGEMGEPGIDVYKRQMPESWPFTGWDTRYLSPVRQDTGGLTCSFSGNSSQRSPLVPVSYTHLVAKRIRQNKRSCLPAIRFLEEKINDYFKS